MGRMMGCLQYFAGQSVNTDRNKRTTEILTLRVRMTAV